MGFTIEDMLTLTGDRYQMSMIAGNRGWSNSISWVLMVEDFTILRNFVGKELAVTMGMGFESQEKLLTLIRQLSARHAAGLIINTGVYIDRISQPIIDLCNDLGLPLLIVPWDIYIAEMIKDLSVRIFLQGMTDEQISVAFIKAIASPDLAAAAKQDLLQYYDVDGVFQIILLNTPGLDTMDTVERKRIGYRMELFLENITHNCSFFYYDGSFVLVCNDIPPDVTDQVIREFQRRMHLKMPELRFYIGIGSRLKNLESLGTAYQRARAALDMALITEKNCISFDQMGIYRLLYLIPDKELLREMSEDLLMPLIQYDKKHDSQFLETLENYLTLEGSFMAMSEKMFIHRNTLMYRMNRIKKLLGTDLTTSEEKLSYQIACLIMHMGQIPDATLR
ncbi:MAG: PucR family transcriptional regulator ligand-binding domain-containing protein [Eubacterium sp.]|nr:PucR family transcriptional regulator ligand-binding domain-containing protein [Eubacterium sp.]